MLTDMIQINNRLLQMKIIKYWDIDVACDWSSVYPIKTTLRKNVYNT